MNREIDISSVMNNAEEALKRINFSARNTDINNAIDNILYDVAKQLGLTTEESIILNIGCILGEQSINKWLLHSGIKATLEK